MRLKNSSTSKTMTYTRFSKIEDREAAIWKLEDISKEDLKQYPEIEIIDGGRSYIK